MLGSAAKEIQKSEDIWNSNSKLREQQEKDFGLWGPYKYAMDEKEGKWDSVTTNSPKILANKIMGLLSSSWMQLFVDAGEVEKEKKKGREEISKTEQLANGAIWMADRELIRVPSGKRIQDSLSSYAVLKGGTVKSVYWYMKKDKDGKEKPVCDIKTYDPEYCQWLEGERDILWFCHRGYFTEQFIKHAYKKQIADGFIYRKPDATDNRILTYTFWDDEEWKVAINGQYIPEEEGEHGLGYVPVNIRSCGPVPYMQSETYKDNTVPCSWMSYAHNTRDIYDLESKLWSIESTKAVDSGTVDAMGEYDSILSTTPNEDIKKVGNRQRKNVLFFDKAKGQKFLGFLQPPGNEVVDQTLTRVNQLLDIMATIDPIAMGVMTRSGSGALAAELRSAALEFINPFRECIEQDFIWIAEESVRQFKNGDYEKVSVEGNIAAKGKERTRFHTDISPKDVEEKRFDCNLVTDRLRDKIQELGAAIQSVSSGLLSVETAMLEHNIVEDPDKEKEKIANEKAAQMAMADPLYFNNQMAKYYKDQGDDQMALYHEELAIEIMEANAMRMAMRKASREMPLEEAGIETPLETPPTPQAEVGGIAAQPREITEEPPI